MKKVIDPPDGFPVFAEQIFESLSKLLGIDETRMLIGFRQFDEIEGGEERPADASEFTSIGKHAPKGKIQPSKRPRKHRP